MEHQNSRAALPRAPAASSLPGFQRKIQGIRGTPATGAIPRHNSGPRLPIPSAVPGSPSPRQRRGRAPRARDAAAAAPARPARCRGDAPSPRRPSRCPLWPPASTPSRKNNKKHLSRHQSRQRHRSVPVLLRALLRLAHHTLPILSGVGHHGPRTASLALFSIEEKAVLPNLSACFPVLWMAAIDFVSLLTLVVSEGQIKKRKTNRKTPPHIYFTEAKEKTQANPKGHHGHLSTTKGRSSHLGTGSPGGHVVAA